VKLHTVGESCTAAPRASSNGRQPRFFSTRTVSIARNQRLSGSQRATLQSGIRVVQARAQRRNRIAVGRQMELVNALWFPSKI